MAFNFKINVSTLYIKYRWFFIVTLLILTSCTNISGWQTRLSNGVYTFKEGNYSIHSPIPAGYCLNIKEDSNNPNNKGAQFTECDGYIQAQYIATLITTKEISEKTFVDTTLQREIPSYLNIIFSPVAKAELTSKEITTVNGDKAIFFSGTANLPDGKTRVLSVRVLLDNKTILSASVISSLEQAKYAKEPKEMPDDWANNPEAVERVFKRFVSSIKKIDKPI